MFDLVVDDMRMVPTLSCKVMLEAAQCLKPNGVAIITLKISPREPLKTVRRCLEILEQSYDILHARQLYHNRNEVTVVARRKCESVRGGWRNEPSRHSKHRAAGPRTSRTRSFQPWWRID